MIWAAGWSTPGWWLVRGLPFTYRGWSEAIVADMFGAPEATAWGWVNIWSMMLRTCLGDELHFMAISSSYFGVNTRAPGCLLTLIPSHMRYHQLVSKCTAGVSSGWLAASLEILRGSKLAINSKCFKQVASHENVTLKSTQHDSMSPDFFFFMCIVSAAPKNYDPFDQPSPMAMDLPHLLGLVG